MDERDYKFMNNELNMENFKLDLTQLTPVAEKDRIKGNWYVIMSNINQYGQICQWHSGQDRINPDNGGKGVPYDFWFLIPPGLPGFPEVDLPDEFEINNNEWEFKPDGYETFSSAIISGTCRRIKHKLPEISIPSGTKSEQIEAVKKILAELETK